MNGYHRKLSQDLLSDVNNSNQSITITNNCEKNGGRLAEDD